MVVFTQGSGQLLVQLFSSIKDKNPVTSANFALLEGKSAELHVAIPDGVVIALAEISLAETGSAVITAFSVVPAFSGAQFKDSSYAVSNTTSFSSVSGVGPRTINLAFPGTPDASLIIKLAVDGIARISTDAQNGLAQTVFAATARAGVEVAIPMAALIAPTPSVTSIQSARTVTVESENGLASVWLAQGVVAPLADLHAILSITAPLDGDYALYRWDLLPETLVFDFEDYSIQDSYLKRLAFFAEKPGFRGRIASDEEIRALHGWNAHDYSSGTLVAFFSMAQNLGFRLNDEEIVLLELLIAHGILARNSGGMITEGRGAIISVSRESTPVLRRVFMDHEASHALFFQDAEYRRLSANLWSSLGSESRRFWKQHLAWRRYDTRDEYLLINELQAYLVQQSLASTRAYYEALVQRLVEAYPADKERLEAESPYVLNSAVEGAKLLDSYLRRHWGLSSGKFGRVRKL